MKNLFLFANLYLAVFTSICLAQTSSYTKAFNQALPIQQTYIKPFNPDSDDYFGYAVAASGNTIAVGAYNEASSISGINASDGSENSVTSGAVYVYVRQNATWVQQAYFKPNVILMEQRFGSALALDGNTLVVGAPLDSRDATGINPTSTTSNTSASGAVYVYVRAGGTWALQAYIKPSDTQVGGEFGYSVSINGDDLIVGSKYHHSQNFVQAGAAYVFKRNGTTWQQQAILKASNPDVDDFFGFSVGIFGDAAIVGAINESGNNTLQSDNSLNRAGAAYIFQRNGSTWSQVKYLKANVPDEKDQFGDAVSIYDNIIAVGIPFEDADENNPNDNTGTVYIYQNINGSWIHNATLSETNSDRSALFGTALDIIKDTIVVGARDYFPNLSDEQGAAYVYKNIDGAWTFQDRYTSFNGETFDFYGTDVGISHSTVVVGARFEDSSSSITSPGELNNPEDNNDLFNSGAAYTYFNEKVFINGFE